MHNPNARNLPSKAELQELVDTAREILPPMQPHIIDLRNIPGMEDTVPFASLKSGMQYNIGDTGVFVDETDDDIFQELNIRLVTAHGDKARPDAVIKSRECCINTMSLRADFTERISPLHRPEHPASAAHLIVENEAQLLKQTSELLHGYALAQSLGMTIVTREVYTEMLTALRAGEASM